MQAASLLLPPSHLCCILNDIYVINSHQHVCYCVKFGNNWSYLQKQDTKSCCSGCRTLDGSTYVTVHIAPWWYRVVLLVCPRGASPWCVLSRRKDFRTFPLSLNTATYSMSELQKLRTAQKVYSKDSFLPVYALPNRVIGFRAVAS